MSTWKGWGDVESYTNAGSKSLQPINFRSHPKRKNNKKKKLASDPSRLRRISRADGLRNRKNRLYERTAADYRTKSSRRVQLVKKSFMYV